MAVSISQVNALTTGALFLVTVPPGAHVIISSVDTATDVAWGTSASVTYASGGLIDPDGPTAFTNPATADPFDIWVIAGTGTHQVSAVVITPH